MLIYSALASASGPRYVTGPPYFTGAAGVAVVWSTMTPLYYTDPGDLSASVNHQAADALVAAAAAVWNLPVARITLAQGGVLNEDVSGANVYLGGTGMVYPDDVAGTNFAAVPIAVIYDADGAVTDTLLGGGASDPSSCRQNAVTESVDRFDPAGYIQHAVLVLNGLCTGPAPEQQQQMQYQLMRAFGRVLGLAWSQTNDNVFTGTPASTYQQAQNWPILHPLDILCGSYSYQCLPQPFTLRPDDIASLATLYPVVSPAPPGKQVSLTQANSASGVLQFPTGEGMAGVNMVFTRLNKNAATPEPWQTASAVTGTYFRRIQATPVAAQGTAVDDSQGGFDKTTEGSYFVGYLPVNAGDNYDTQVISSEPVNPLYTGSYAVGPYVAGGVLPSGSPMSNRTTVYANTTAKLTTVIPDASSQCGNGADGTLSAPAPADVSGWWNGLLCAYGHFAWTSLNVQPGRSFTMEVTALDEQGNATSAKAMPVIGAWAASDSLTALPTLGAATTPFNGLVNGMTTLTVASGSATSIRLVVADQRGDGRPDFAYQARLFYADSLAPATVGTAGGDTLTITGMGFRAGNIVQVNGVEATPISASSNNLVVAVPSLSAAFARSGTAVDVTVSDLTTGATSTLPAALTYSNTASQPNVMKLLTAQVGTSFSGQAASVPFAVQILKPDGVTPVVSEPVTFSGSVAGQPSALQCGACSRATCVVMSDATGVASTAVIPLSAGAVTLQATDKTVTLQSTFTAIAPAGSVQVVSAPSGSVYAGRTAAAAFTVKLLATDGRTPMAGRQITFSATTGVVSFNACSASTCVVTTDANGLASTGVTPSTAGPVTLLATDGLVSQTASFTALDNTPVLKILAAPVASGYINSGLGGFTVGLYQADGITPIAQQQIVFTSTSTADGTLQGAIFTQCGTNPCIVTTNNQGQAAAGQVYLTQIGTYTIQAAYGTAVQSFGETVLAAPRILRLISAPTGNQPIGQVSPTLFKVQSLQSNGVTPYIIQVTLTGIPGQVSFGACAFPSCILTADANGYVSSTVTPLVPGPIALQAEELQLVVTAEMNGVASTDIMQLVSAPTGTLYAGQAVTTPFAVQVIGAGQSTPTPGKVITFSVASGTGTFSACGLSTCTLVTDATGTASSLFTPLSTGAVTLLAADGTVTQRASFTVSSTQDVLRLVSAPNGSIYVGDVAAVPFAARLLLYDGVTPDAGKNVTLSVTRGSAMLGCGAASCVVTSDASGNVSTTITPLAVGSITLLASSGPLTQTASLTAVAKPDIVHVVSVPSGLNYSGVLSATPFAVQVLAGDGVTPTAGRNVTFSITNGSGVFFACGQPTCTLATDAAGMASSLITPTSTGTLSLLAADGAVTQSASFVVVSAPDVLSLVSTPSGGAYVGDVAAVPFAVRLSLYGGVAPDPGKSVIVSVTGGSATLGCGAASCVVTTDAGGNVSLTVKPLAAGTVTLLASSGSLSQTASFIAVEKPESLQPVSVPSGSSYIGTAFVTPFAVQVLAGDGVTPVAGRNVTFTVTSGLGRLSACAADSCNVVSDVDGIASVVITPLAEGTVVLQAADGAAVQEATVTGIADTEALIASVPQLFMAEGAVVPWTLAAAAILNGSPGAGIPVSWTGSSGLSVSGAQSLTDATGLSTISAVAGPLAAGLSASAQACAWGMVCASFQAVSVSASEWRVVVVSGAGQVVTGGALQPVVARVIDGAGHSIAGAPMTIHETVTEQTMACPTQGRCPAAPVLASKTLSAVTDVSGQVTITPPTVDGASTATNVTISAGTQGFATAVLLRSP